MVHIQSKGHQLMAVLWAEVTIAFSIILLRYYTRTFIGGAVGPDDYLLIASWVLMTSFAGLITASVYHGMGTHVEFLTIDDISQGILYLLAGQTTISLSMGLSKCAVAVFLMRIVNKTWHKIILWFWMISMMFLSVFLGIAVFAQCTPSKAIWDPRVTGKVCHLNLALVAEIMCSWSAAMDFFLALFPWFVIWNLNLKRKERITICTSLSLGLFAGICGIIRTTGLNALNNSTDYLWAVSDSVMWTMSELTLTIICVSMPAFRPLWNKFRGGSSTGGPYHQQSNTRDIGGQYKMKSMLSSSKGGSNQYDVEVGGGDKDTDSDTFILHEQKGHKFGGIQRSQEVTVTYEDSGVNATTAKQHV